MYLYIRNLAGSTLLNLVYMHTHMLRLFMITDALSNVEKPVFKFQSNLALG